MKKEEKRSRHEIVERVELEVNDAISHSGVGRIVAGISGGADSTAMLLALANSGVKVHAIHCNFNLRGEESRGDREFVERLCQELEIPLICFEFDTIGYMQLCRCSVEVACRDLRYEKFHEQMKLVEADRICVAHNSDDQAETLLLNLFRGAGTRGLGAMRQDTGVILRPLLNVNRKEILAYLDHRGYSHREDSSNERCDYRRNFIRNQVLPLIATRWESIADVLCRTSHSMQHDEEILQQYYKSKLHDENTLIIDHSDTPASRSWLASRFARAHGAKASQAAEISNIANKSPVAEEKIWHTPAGIISFRQNKISFIHGGVTKKQFEIEATLLNGNKLIEKIISEAGNSVLLTPLSPNEIEFRYAAEGDKISPLGMSGQTKVSKIHKDAHLDKIERANSVVAIHRDSGELIWVDGLKRSRHHLVDKEDSQAYCYKITRKANDD